MNPYVRLADHINTSFQLGLRPHTEKDAFVKIFQLLLTEDDADIICHLSSNLENLDEISHRINIDKELLRMRLKEIAEKGIIYKKEHSFKLMPFFPGIFEAVGSILETDDIADLLQENIKDIRVLKREEGNKKYRVLPVNVEVSLQITSSTTSEILSYINQTDQFALMDCICRKINMVRNKACGHPVKDMCMIIGEYAQYFIEIGSARIASREEMIDVLKKADAAGLYHEIYPIEKGNSLFVCNCCTCGCKFMGLANRISSVVSFKNRISIDYDRCDLCGECISECPEKVFSIQNKKIDIIEKRCYNCGLCSLICHKKAIHIDDLC